MGNVESRPINRPVIEVSHKSARPLPPLPDDDSDEYDLDSPPPYPPPPPPHEENGGKSKRVSWKFRESNFFGGLKRGSWMVQPHSQNESSRKYSDSKKGTPAFTGKNISNTIATEDNSVVTVSVIGTPDKDEIVKGHQNEANTNITMDGSQNSWAVRNMQLVLNSEMQTGETGNGSNRNSSDSNKVEPNLGSSKYPYPDVQTYSENEVSSLPDVVTVKSRLDDRKLEASYDPVVKETVHLKRVEDIRIDYPEGKTREVSNYNTLEYKVDTSVQPLSLGPAVEGHVDVSVKNDSKSKKGKLSSCFGKRKADDLSDDEFHNTNLGVDRERSGASSPESKTLSLSPSSELNLNVTPTSSTPKKTKTTKLGSCFGKSSPNDEIDGPLSTSTPDIDSKLNLRGSGSLDGSSERVEYITPKLEVEYDADASLRKDVKSPKKQKGNLGSCFGKGESGKHLDDEYKEGRKTDIETSPTQISIKESDSKADIKPKHGKQKGKSSLGACFGKDSKSNELTNANEEFEIKSDLDPVVAKVEVPQPEIQFDKQIMVKNIKVDNEIVLPKAEAELKSPENINVSIDSPTVEADFDKKLEIGLGNFNINSELEKSHENHLQSTNVNISSPSEKVYAVVSPEFSITPPSIEMKAPELILTDSGTDANLALDLSTAESVSPDIDLGIEGKAELMYEDMDVAYSPDAEFKDKRFGLNKNYEIIPPCIDLTIASEHDEDIRGKLKSEPVDIDRSLNIDVNPPSMDIKESFSLPSPNAEINISGIETQKLEMSGNIPKLEIDPNIDMDVTVASPDLEGKVDVKTPSVDIDFPSAKVEFPSSQNNDAELRSDLDLDLPKVEAKSPKGTGKGRFKFGSCLGKDKSKSPKLNEPETSAEVTIPEGDIKGSVQVEAPKIEGDLNIPKNDIDVKGPKADGKGKLGLGSCFGKSKTPKVKSELNIPDSEIPRTSLSGEVRADTSLKSPEVEIKGDIDAPILKGDIDVESSEVKLDGKKKKASLGSCFGKRKSPDIEAKKPSLEIESEIKGAPKVEDVTANAEVPSVDVPSKKKKVNLGSCFGKKDKVELKADVDIEPPKAEISAEIPSVNIKGNIPDITVDPKVEGDMDVDLDGVKPEFPSLLPSAKIEGNIPEASVDIDVPSISLKSPEVDLDAPKYDIGLEGKSHDISISPNVDLDVKSPEIDLKNDLDFSVEVPELPSAEFDVSLSGNEFKAPVMKGEVKGEMPKFDQKIDIGASIPKIEMDIGTPDISVDKEIALSVSTPNIEVPEVDLEVKTSVPSVDIKGPDVKGKKVKSKMPSCFGKSEKGKKDDVYIPSCEGDVSVKLPEVSGGVEVQPPSIEGEISSKKPDINVETKKPKGKFGSCFGKPKSPKTPKIEGKLSTSVEGDLPTLKGEVNVPKAEVKVDVKEKPKKSSSGLGSCFGKKSKIDASVESPSTKVETPGEISVDIDSPKVKSDIKVDDPNLNLKVDAKKPKNKFGSCFGKPKADVDVTVPSPELEGEVGVKAPSSDVDLPSATVEGSVDIPSSQIDAELRGDLELPDPKVKVKAPKGSGKGKFKFGSCLGKDKSKSVKLDKPEASAEVKIPEGDIKGSIEVEAPKIEGDVNTGKNDIDVKGPKADGKGKLGLGSCFGKSKTPKVKSELNVPESDISHPSFSGEAGADINLKGPEVEIKCKTDAPILKDDIDVDAPKVKLDGKKKKGSLGSCFGKRKSPDIETKEPILEVEGDMKGSQPIGGELKAKVDAPSVDISPKKKKVNFGSCFGKKDKAKLKADVDIEPPKAELSLGIPSVNIEGNIPDVSVDPKVEGAFNVDIEAVEPELSTSTEIEGNIPQASVDIDVPSISLKSPQIDLDVPKYDIGLEGRSQDISISPNIDLDGKAPKIDVEGEMDFSVEVPKIPTAELDVDLGGMDINVPEGEMPNLEHEIDMDCNFPKVDMEVETPDISLEKEGTIKVTTPDIQIETPDVKLGEIKVEGPSVDIKGPHVKGKKVKSKMPSCFGKPDKVKKDDAYMPSCEGDVSVKLPEVSGGVEVGSPSIEGEISTKRPDINVETKKPKGKFGSCFGKPKSPKTPKVEGKLSTSVEGDLPTLKGEVNVPKAEIKVDVKDKPKKSNSGLGSCFGKKSKIDGSVEGPSTDVKLPSGEVSVDIDSPKVKSDIKVDEPNLNLNVEAKKPKSKFGSCFGKPKADVDVTVPSPKLEGEVDVKTSSADIDLPAAKVEGSVDIPYSQIDEAELKADLELHGPNVEAKAPKGSSKGKFKFGSCLGKDKSKSVKLDKPEASAEVKAPEGNIEGSIEVKAPKIKGDVNILNEDVDVKGPKAKSVGKGKLGLGSCFGKSKSPKVKSEINVPDPSISGETGADIDIKSPKVEIKCETDAPVLKGDIDVEAPKVKFDGKKKKGSLGSCFGKRKSPDIETNKPILEIEADIKKSEGVEGDVKAKVDTPAVDVSPKKKKVNLGSCFGKKDKMKFKADVDIEPPKTELSAKTPSVNIEGNIPDITVDPKVEGDVKVDIEGVKQELPLIPSTKFEGKIPEASVDVDVPLISIKSPEVDLDVPKYDIGLEGRSQDISISPNIDLDGKSSEIDVEGDVDFSVKVPKLPSAELDVGLGDIDINVSDVEVKMEGEMPNLKHEIDIDSSLPKVDMEVEIPNISLEKEGTINVTSPDIEIETPDVKMGDIRVDAPSVDIKSPNVKVKKVKTKMPSCFGKQDKIKKDDAYMPSCEGDVSVKLPEVSGGVEVESPSIEGEISTTRPDINVETKKPKGKFGSCFGKPKSPKTPTVEGKLSTSVEGDLPTLKGEVNIPKAEVKVDVKEKPKQSSSGLGSCFGKKSKIDGSMEGPSTDVKLPSGEVSVDIDSPEVKSDIKVDEPSLNLNVDAKKPKSKFGSCFGKPKADVDVTVPSPELGGEVDVKTPRADIDLPSAKVEGSLDIPSSQNDDAELRSDLNLHGPKVEAKSPKGSGKGKFKLGSCLGKDKSKSVKLDKPEASAELTIPEGSIKGSVEVQTPKIEGDVNIAKEDIGVKGPKAEAKGKLGLGSCFGKSKSPKVKQELKDPDLSISGEAGADVNIKSPEVEIKGEIDAPILKGDIDVEAPKVKLDGKKKKSSLGSCFGKRKSPDIETKSPLLEVEGEVKGTPGLAGSSKTKVECDVSPKKKKINLGSCFGKKDKVKLNTDIDIEPPKVEISEEIPSVNIEGNIPDIIVDPKVEDVKVDIEVKPEFPSAKIEGDIPEASVDIDVPSVSLKSPEIDLDVPKYDIGLEGKSHDISISPNVDLDVKSPEIDLKNDLDFSVEVPDLPSAEFDVSLSGDEFKAPVMKGEVKGEVPKFDQKIDIDASIPKIEMDIGTPDISVDKEIALSASTPDVEVPEVDLEVKTSAPSVDIKGPDVKGKKVKSKMPSCFGKPDKVRKDDAYMPSCEGDVSVKLPEVSGGVEVESPSIKGEISTKRPYIDVETKKPKGKLGSCFGKPKSSKTPTVEGKLSTSVEGDLPTLKGELDLPKAEVKVDVKEKPKKSSSGFGSCFGKKSKIDGSVEGPSTDVKLPSGEVSVDIDSPKVKSDIKVDDPNLNLKVDAKKPKSKFGSCFGKPKADVDVTVPSPELGGEVDVKTPRADIDLPTAKVSGSVDIPSRIDNEELRGDLDLHGPKVEAKVPKGSGNGKFKFGSCLGKDGSKSVKLDKPESSTEVTIPGGDIKGSIEVEAPKIEGDVNIGKNEIDVKGPKADGKGKLGLGSCFGKSKTPKVQSQLNVPDSDISHPSLSGEAQTDVSLKGPEVEIKSKVDVSNLKGDIDVESPEIKLDGKKKKKGSLGSCFGKQKSPDIEAKKPTLEVEGEIKGVPSLGGDIKTKTEGQSVEVSSKKKKGNLGSCFGKKDKVKLKTDIDIEHPNTELSADIPSVNIEGNIPDVAIDPKLKVGAVDVDIEGVKPEFSLSTPSSKIEGSIPEASIDIDVPSISLKSPEVDLDVPKYEIGLEGKSQDISVSPNIDLDVKYSEADLKGDMDLPVEVPNIPSAELDIDLGGMDINAPVIADKIEGETPKFDNKLEIDCSFPKVEMEVETPKISVENEDPLNVTTPNIEVPDMELGEVKMDAPTVDIKGPKIKEPKVKSKMPSCFGKSDKSIKDDSYMPSCESDVSVKLPEVSGEVKVESPSIEGKISTNKPDINVETKKPKGKFGSCFGKPKSPKTPTVEGKLSTSVEADLPTLKGEVDVPKAEVKVDVKDKPKKSDSGLGSCFGKKSKVDASVESPSIDVGTPSGEASVHVDSPRLESDIKVDEPNVNLKVGANKPKSKFGSCFGKPKVDIDVTVDSPELEGEVDVKTPGAKIDLPPAKVEGSVDIPSGQIVDADLSGDLDLHGPKVEAKVPKGSGQGKFKLGSCLGKNKSKSAKLDKPETSADVTIPEAGIKGSIEIEAPEIEGDVNIGKNDIDVKGPKSEGKGKLGLGSCFGKSKSPKVKAELNVPDSENSHPSISGDAQADVSLKSPEVEIKGELDAPILRGEIDVEAPEAKLDGKKKKGSLGSCFGKSKSPDIQTKKPVLAGGDVKAEAEVLSVDVPAKKKNVNLGSCFGKKDKMKLNADVDAELPKSELSAEIPSVNIEGNIPDVTLDPKVKVDTIGVDIEGVKPEFSLSTPSSKIEGNIPESSIDIDAPLVSLKSPEIDVDIPKYEIGLEGRNQNLLISPNADLEIKSDVDLKEESNFSVDKPHIPRADLKIGVDNVDSKLPVIEAKIEGEVPKFDQKIDIDGDFSKVDMEVETLNMSLEKDVNLNVTAPDVEVEIPDIGLEVKQDVPTIDIKGPKLKEKKGKSKIPSCFGKGNKVKDDSYSPTCEHDLVIKSTNDVAVELPSTEGKDIPSESLPRSKKKKINFGSCLGRKSSIPINADKEPAAPELNISSEVSLPENAGQISAQVSNDVDFSPKSLSISEERNLDISLPENRQAEPNGFQSNISIDFPSINFDENSFKKCPSKKSDNDQNEVGVVIDPALNFGEYDVPKAEKSRSSEYDYDLSGDFLQNILDQLPSNIGHISTSSEGITIGSLSTSVSTSVVDNERDKETEIRCTYPGIDHVYENVDPLVVAPDIIPKLKSTTYEIDSSSNLGTQKTDSEDHTHPNERDDVIRSDEPGKSLACSLGSDVKVHFESDYDTPKHPEPVYSNIDSKIKVAIPTYENLSFVSPHSLSAEKSQDENLEVPKPPKRWYGIDRVAVEGTIDVPDLNFNTDSTLKDTEIDASQSIPSEAKSDFQSIQFVKQMVEIGESEKEGDGVIEGKFSLSKPTHSGQFHIEPTTSDYLSKKLKEFDNENYDSQPSVIRTIKVKTFKINEGTGEPEELLEEFEAEGEEMKIDAAKRLSKKLAELHSGYPIGQQPEITKTVRIKTYTTKGSNEPDEVIEEFVNKSEIPFDSSILFKNTLDRNKGERDNENFEIKCEEQCGDFDTSDLLIKKLTAFDIDSSRPVVTKTVKVKTYSTKDGDNDSEEIVEEFEGNEDSSLGTSEARKYILQKIADFDGKGISGEPFVKRTVRVKTYKTKDGSDDTETIDEFEHSSTDLSLSDILHDRYPELRETKFESQDILKSLENPDSQGTLLSQSNITAGEPVKVQGSIQFAHDDKNTSPK